MHAEDQLGDFEAVASYRNNEGRVIFTFCLDGLLIDPDGQPRFVPYTEINRTSYYSSEELKAEKQLQMSKSLALWLSGCETIEIPLNQRTDELSERLAIGGLIEQRIRLAKATNTTERHRT